MHTLQTETDLTSNTNTHASPSIGYAAEYSKSGKFIALGYATVIQNLLQLPN